MLPANKKRRSSDQKKSTQLLVHQRVPVPKDFDLASLACMHRTTPAIGAADIGSVGDVSWEGTPFLGSSEKGTWENVRRRTVPGYATFKPRRTLI